MNEPSVTCPVCGKQAHTDSTRYGFRHSCCGLHSWNGRPLVQKEVHALRKIFHAEFDPLWKGDKGEDAPIPGASKQRRAEAYQALAKCSGYSEEDCHGAQQMSAYILLDLIEAARELRAKEESKRA